jgi:hypothetical protein
MTFSRFPALFFQPHDAEGRRKEPKGSGRQFMNTSRQAVTPASRSGGGFLHVFLNHDLHHAAGLSYLTVLFFCMGDLTGMIHRRRSAIALYRIERGQLIPEKYNYILWLCEKKEQCHTILSSTLRGIC